MGSWPGFVLHLDAHDRVVYLNRVREGGRHRDELVGHPLHQLVVPEDEAHAREACERARATGEPQRIRVRAEEPDGSRTLYDGIVVSSTATPEGVNLTIFALDQTELHRAAQESERTVAKLELARQATGMAVWETSLPSGEGSWGEGMEAIHGGPEPRDAAEYAGRFVHPDDRHVLEAAFLDLPKRERISMEYRIRRPSDGEIRLLRAFAQVLREDRGTYRVVGGVIDITKERELFERERRAQKLGAVGTLTAGVAKRFSDVLTVLTTILDEVGNAVPTELHDVLDDAEQAVSRGTDLVTDLLAFAGRGSEGHRPLRLDELAAQVARLCEQTFGRQAEIRTSIEGPLWVQGDSSALHQVLMNLMINARDAIADGGAIRLLADARDESVRVTVSDDGPGMSAEVADRIFEPFYSTKGVSGTGLGLSSSLGIVRDHGGELQVDPGGDGRGATFTVVLPRIEEP